MTWRDTFRTAAEAVRTHRLRSALTMLGILIGITAVILTVGLGQGAKAEVPTQINELGTNLLVVSPGSTTNSTGVRGGFGSSSTLTVSDAAALARRDAAPDIEAVAPDLDHAGLADQRHDQLDHDAHRHHAALARRSAPARSRAAGSSPTPTRPDAANVVVLGPDTATELFASATRSARRSPTTAPRSRWSACSPR